MEVARVREISQVQMIVVEPESRASVSKHMPQFPMLQVHGDPGASVPHRHNAGQVDSGISQFAVTNSCEIVAGCRRDEPYSVSKRRQIVSRDRARSADTNRHVAREEFALARQLVGESVEEDVEICVSDDGNVEATQCGMSLVRIDRAHAASSGRAVNGYRFCVSATMPNCSDLPDDLSGPIGPAPEPARTLSA